ncbi:MAG TPA: dienelactone hydrolase family protein [Longilinea sp.]|nr:dienelactone hydrolase family protein [Longilinea sp.]
MADISQNGYLALPQSGKGAGILVLHAWWGLNDFFKDCCERLAQEGFVALAPDLYHGKIATTIEEAKKLRAKMDREQVSADILSMVTQLQQLPAVTGKSLGTIGFSLGAYWALWLSLEKPEYIKAVTVFYGTRTADYSQSQAAYLGHFATADDWVAASGVKKLEKSLHTANRSATFHTYEGTGHWFFEKDRPDAYNAAAAQLAWERTLAFLRAQLVE